MLYAPLVSRRETPYGLPPVERALLPIISGLQKQEYQLDFFQEGTVPACYISPGDPNMTPTQIKELQDALNGIAGDPAYHLKVIVLPAGSKVDPQRPVDLSDSFDFLVMNQTCMAFDVSPVELGIVPDVGATSTGPSASGIKFNAQESRSIKSRKSTKPLLKYLCDIMNYVLQDICGQADMEFTFEGLRDEQDEAAIVSQGVELIQNGIYSIDEVRDLLDKPPWGLEETTEPVVFTAQGPIPLSMAKELIANLQGQGTPGAQGTNGNQRTVSSRSRTSQPNVRKPGQVRPNGSHPAPVSPHRESVTPAHSAAAGAIQSPGPRTGGTPSRSSVAGSRKKAVESELGALARHLRKGRLISTWEARHISARALGMIAEDIAKGVLIDTAVERAGAICLKEGPGWAATADGSQDHSPASAPGGLGYPAGLPGDDHPVDHLGNPGLVGKAAPHWPGWERDLGLVGAYKHLIGQAFHDAETRGSELRKKAATGAMFVSNATLRDLISDEVREVFSGTLEPLWTEAWHLGYAAAKSLVTGQAADFTDVQDSEAMLGFLNTQGEHWVQQISRTGLGNNSVRSETIAWSEVGRAVNTAAIQCYRDYGVSHKHLLLSPNACDICKEAAEDGDIPLDAPFSVGGVIGQCHIRCRCAPAPSGVSVEPPLADLGKSAGIEDRTRAAFLMLRARHPEDGKPRYLLHQRKDGTWGLPGGTPHVGEPAHAAAIREATEEIGDLPFLGAPQAVRDYPDDGRTVVVHLHDVPFFQPANNGATPEETAGTGWFRRREVRDLDLHPPFREQRESTDWKHAGEAAKALQRMVNEDGEVLTLTPASQALQAVGSRWPYPKRSDGSEWPDAGPGAVPGDIGSAGGEPPHWSDDMAEPEPRDTLEPRGGDDGKMPSRGRKPAPPAGVFPNQGYAHDEMWPQPQATLTPGAFTVGGRTGVPPSGEKRAKVSKASVNYRQGSPARNCGNCVMFRDGSCDLVAGNISALDVCDEWEARPAEKNDSGHPVTGSVPAETPKPYAPHAIEPQAFDPAETVEQWSPSAGSNVVHDLPETRKGASDLRDPNPVEAEHVYSQLLQNYPPDSIAWVKQRGIRWIGPVLIPLDRVDVDDEESWAASHQAGAVRRFARGIDSGTGHTHPVVMVQAPDRRPIVIDGHHRFLAYRSLGRPVKAYVGYVDKVTPEMLETHSSQFHSGSDPQNK